MADLLVQTHGLVQRIDGRMDGVEQAILNGKKQRGELYEKIGDLEKNTVRRSECEKVNEELKREIPKIVEHSVTKAMNGRKRSRWLVIKDIILVVLSTSLPILVGYVVWMLSQGKFSP